MTIEQLAALLTLPARQAVPLAIGREVEVLPAAASTGAAGVSWRCRWRSAGEVAVLPIGVSTAGCRVPRPDAAREAAVLPAAASTRRCQCVVELSMEVAVLPIGVSTAGCLPGVARDIEIRGLRLGPVCRRVVALPLAIGGEVPIRRPLFCSPLE